MHVLNKTKRNKCYLPSPIVLRRKNIPAKNTAGNVKFHGDFVAAVHAVFVLQRNLQTNNTLTFTVAKKNFIYSSNYIFRERLCIGESIELQC